MVKLPVISYFASSIDEAKKVVWPTREIVLRHTVMVVISVAIAVLIFSGIDYGLQKLVILAIK